MLTNCSAQIAERLSSFKDAVVVSLFCQEEISEYQTYKAMLCHAILQLLQKEFGSPRPIPSCVMEAYHKYPTELGGLRDEECKELLLSLIKECPRCFVVLDGLDEYGSTGLRNEATDLFSSLYLLTEQDKSQCRMLVASRDDLLKWYWEKFDLSLSRDIIVEARDDHIKSFISERVGEKFPACRKTLEAGNDLEDIADAVVKRAKGV
jgi:hypothetical protein